MATLLVIPFVAHGAESYDNCAGFITSVPASIDTAGTWCLNQNLSTAITSGNAISINVDNVVLDCNDFKLDGSAAGISTNASGIAANNRYNVTVRHCNVRGFLNGLSLYGSSGGGHKVEDNRVDGNTSAGIGVAGYGSVVRRNRVFDTGGTTLSPYAYGIYTVYSVDVLDNTVSGVVPRSGSNGRAYGIFTNSNLEGSVSGNRVRGVLKDGVGSASGLVNPGSDRIVLRNNDLIGDASVGGFGLSCGNANGHARDNIINGFATGLATCTNDGGNVIKP